MKKFIQSSLSALILLTAVSMNGCDIFEDFQFNVPITYTFETSGSNLYDERSECLDENVTLKDLKNKIKSIKFVEAYLVVLNINPENIQGDIILKLYGGASASGSPIIEYTLENVKPSDYQTNPLKLDFKSAGVQSINSYLANKNNPRCFFGTLEISDIQNGGTSNSITVRVDMLFEVDSDL